MIGRIRVRSGMWWPKTVVSNRRLGDEGVLLLSLRTTAHRWTMVEMEQSAIKIKNESRIESERVGLEVVAIWSRSTAHSVGRLVQSGTGVSAIYEFLGISKAVG